MQEAYSVRVEFDGHPIGLPCDAVVDEEDQEKKGVVLPRMSMLSPKLSPAVPGSLAARQSIYKLGAVVRIVPNRVVVATCHWINGQILLTQSPSAIRHEMTRVTSSTL